MLFNSSTFLVFLGLVFVIYWKSVKYSSNAGNIILLISSYVFYGWWDWRFLILIFISTLTDFYAGKYIFQSQKNNIRKILLWCSLVVNLGLLFTFKYFDFFIDSFQHLFGIVPGSWNSLQIILPVGISFYTFQTMSYTIDIYRRRFEPTESLLSFFTFVAFFPQLVAGPIERASRLIPQFEKKPAFNEEKAYSGLKLMLWGFFKKMVIADQFSKLVDPVYTQPGQFNGIEIVLATFAFGIQIYCDFSGYSDIAIGTARLFGIELMTNFKTPYFANSFRDFWHRWHISLSTWFRDYLYIPLGGNRGNSLFKLKNILITFTVSGLWHGADLTFILWGFIHGVLYAFELFISPIIRIGKKFKNVTGTIFTFLAINFCWLFFRAQNMNQLKILFSKMMEKPSFKMSNLFQQLISENHLTEVGQMVLFAFPFFIFIEVLIRNKSFELLLAKRKKPVRWGFYYFILLMILIFGVLNTAPQFIYFQF